MSRTTVFIAALFAWILATPFPAQAQTAISNETANRYFTQCMASDDPRMSDEAQEHLCSCTSVKMMSVMTDEDMAILSRDPGPGRVAYDKMLADAYAPCMEIPVREQLYGECMIDKKIQQFALRNQSALCDCMAGQTTAMLPVEAPAMIRFALKQDPKLEDIYESLHSNPEFRKLAYHNLFSCLHKGN